jgi:hypothetical protein
VAASAVSASWLAAPEVMERSAVSNNRSVRGRRIGASTVQLRSAPDRGSRCSGR